MNRRHLLKLLLAAPLLRCASGEEVAHAGRLMARPTKPTHNGAVGNVEPLALGSAERDGVVYAAPDGDRASRPLLLLLHGATGSGAHLLKRVQSQITTPGVVIAAPDSRGMTWDVVRSGLGPDVAFIDEMLRAIFDRYAVDRARIAVAGFSDGASYALTLGLTNGDLFRHVMAFSPGFLSLKKPSAERPRVFIAHGREDDILSFEESGQRVAGMLERGGYDVTFRPFDGGHTVKPEVVRQAMAWWSLPAPPRPAILPSS
ncbi:MAG TPA: alpha/beta hydrolase-fold protein [Thermoanaerobaculia bacterium]|nr:alpha/beta hydrolase-fold protein [Thermoanaerobaculia bacterium]